MTAPRETLNETIKFSSLSVLIGLIPHYVLFYALGTPLWTERIAESIMAHTPSRYAVAILDLLGAWAKPLAITGALATLGFAVFVARWAGQHAPPRLRTWTTVVLAILLLIILMRAFHYWSWVGAAAFAIPALLALHVFRSAKAGHPAAVAAPRRQFIGGGVELWIADFDEFRRSRRGARELSPQRGIYEKGSGTGSVISVSTAAGQGEFRLRTCSQEHHTRRGVLRHE